MKIGYTSSTKYHSIVTTQYLGRHVLRSWRYKSEPPEVLIKFPSPDVLQTFHKWYAPLHREVTNLSDAVCKDEHSPARSFLQVKSVSMKIAFTHQPPT